MPPLTRSIIKWTFFLLTLACLFQLSLTIPVVLLEKQIKAEANEFAYTFPDADAYQIKSQYLDQRLNELQDEVLLSIPGIVDYTYANLKSRQLQLGLDLQGGRQFVLYIDRYDLEEQLLATDPAISRDQINALYLESLQRTQYILRERLNGSGFSQCQVSLHPRTGNIQVETPNIYQGQRIRQLLLQTAQLEFWHTYRITDPGLQDAFLRADELLGQEGDFR